MARRGDGEDVIVYFRIAIKGQPLAQIGQAPGEVHSAEAGAGVVARELFPSVGVADAVEAMPERTQRNRRVVHPSPDNGALKSEFKVRCGLDGNFFRMDPGAHGIVMALQRSHEKIISDESYNAGDVGDVQRLNPIDAKAPNIFRIVAPGHTA